MILEVNMFEIMYLLLKPYWFIIALIIIIAAFLILYNVKKYKDSSYYKVTKNGYFSVLFDKGKMGEYQIYKWLKDYEKIGAKFLFNVYIPKDNNETTEIDVLMITTKGIFVFESKNYSGWIFGSENQKYWTQTLPQGKGKSCKSRFLNPIIQNAGHIKHLKNMLGSEIVMHSIIAFSERCTLKKISLQSNVKVVNRDYVSRVVASIFESVNDELVDVNKIDEIYNKLYIYTQVSDDIKQQHIQNINSKK